MLVAAFTASAQDDFRFGYCDNSESISDKNVSMNGAQTLEAATQILGEDLARFSNGKISGINVGLSTRYNVSSVRAWLRNSLTGEDIASAEITPGSNPSLKDGWNAVKFDTPVNIESGKNYYAGYTMTLTKVSSIAIIGRQTGSHAESCWLKVGNGEWTDYSNDYGLLTVELLVQSDNLPQYDLELTRATSFDTYITNDKNYTVQYDIHNAGVKPVTSYTLRLSDEKNGINITKEMTCDLKTDERQKKIEENFTFTGLMPERTYNFILSIEKPNGIEDETPENNSIALPSISSINKMFARTVLVEEFTSEACKNCPTAANNVHQMYNSFSADDQKRVAIVCHHAGFSLPGQKPDFLTQPCDEAMLIFYPEYPAVYAPAIMYDRAKSPSGSPVTNVQSASGIKNSVSTRMAEEAFYSIDATGKHDAEARKLTLRIEGKSAANVFNNPRITVYLLEDNVASYNQGGATSSFKHNHVIRAYNSTWGTAPVWDDDFSYHYDCTLTYPESVVMNRVGDKQTLNPANFEIVAVISNYDADDKNNCEVGNVFKCKLADLKSNPSGIATTEASNVRVYSEAGSIRVDGLYDNVDVYDLSGRKTGMENLPAGIYLVRVNTADGNVQAKVLVK